MSSSSSFPSPCHHLLICSVMLPNNTVKSSFIDLSVCYLVILVLHKFYFWSAKTISDLSSAFFSVLIFGTKWWQALRLRIPKRLAIVKDLPSLSKTNRPFRQLAQSQSVLGSCSWVVSMLKRYIVFLSRIMVDRYLIIILVMLFMGMVFAIMRTPPSLELFYAQLAGALVIIVYNTIKKRRTQPRAKRK